LAQARKIAAGWHGSSAVAKQYFEWVRDNIKHGRGFRMPPVPCSASKARREGCGYCFAKSHLLASPVAAIVGGKPSHGRRRLLYLEPGMI